MNTLTIPAAAIGNRDLTLVVHEFPEIMLEPVRTALAESLYFVPRTLRRLSVNYGGANDRHVAEIEVHEFYRRATMTLYNGWASDPPAERRLAVLHELAHVWVKRYDQAIEDMAGHFFPDDKPIRAATQEFAHTALESVVEDLAILFNELIESGAVKPVPLNLGGIS